MANLWPFCMFLVVLWWINAPLFKILQEGWVFNGHAEEWYQNFTVSNTVLFIFLQHYGSVNRVYAFEPLYWQLALKG